jgi:hypothetical protein
MSCGGGCKEPLGGVRELSSAYVCMYVRMYVRTYVCIRFYVCIHVKLPFASVCSCFWVCTFEVSSRIINVNCVMRTCTNRYIETYMHA